MGIVSNLKQFPLAGFVPTRPTGSGSSSVLGIAQLLQPKPNPQVPPDYDRNIRDVEIRDPSCSGCQRAVALEDPRYGLRDVEVRQSGVWVVLRDNGLEDVVNLFHSFLELHAVLLNIEFSISEQRGGCLKNTAEIGNILTQAKGGSRSDMLEGEP